MWWRAYAWRLQALTYARSSGISTRIALEDEEGSSVHPSTLHEGARPRIAPTGPARAAQIRCDAPAAGATQAEFPE